MYNLTILVIIGNALVVAGHLIDFIAGYFFNEKPTILKFNILTSIISTIANICFKAVGGIISTLTTILRLIVIYLKDKYNKKFIIPFIVICILYLNAFWDWRGIASIFLVVSSFCAFLPKWFSKNVQHMRIGGLLANITNIPYYLIIQNYTGIIISIINSITISISIIKWHLSLASKKQRC